VSREPWATVNMVCHFNSSFLLVSLNIPCFFNPSPCLRWSKGFQDLQPRILEGFAHVHWRPGRKCVIGGLHGQYLEKRNGCAALP
jgi:hypothetical protein